MRTHRAHSLRVLAATFALLMLATSCVETEPEVTAEQRISQAKAELLGNGSDEEIAECVVRLARRELRFGQLSDLAREELILTCERTRDLLNGAEGSEEASGQAPESLAMVDGPNVYGDDPELDSLWLGCEEGSGAACDELFDSSPLGSEYEQFGVSCGERQEVLNCSELDEEPPETVNG